MTFSPAASRPPREVPTALADALRAAHRAEAAAVGPQRRAAFRFTRILLGGAVDAGYPPQLLADCLGVTVGNVRGRATPDAWIALEDLAPFVPAGTLAQWRAAATLGPPELGPTGEEHYPAVAVVRALTAVSPASPDEPDEPGEPDEPDEPAGPAAEP